MAKKDTHDDDSISEVLRLPQGPVDMASLDAGATPGFPGQDKDDAPALLEQMGPEISDLQERLYANGRVEGGDERSVLMILQGMDTSGKGGVIRHAIGLVDPQGVHLKAFKAPTEEERQHHYLWRIEKEVPAPGMIGIFDRSQYEDVLVVRVDELVPVETWKQRYAEINEFEAKLAERGTTIIKCFLNVSRDEQKQRLLERLENSEKHWKYNPGDVDSRSKWPAYQEAYAEALEKTNTDIAPWHVVPADRKWYRNWACAQLLLEHLRALRLEWPAATFDVDAELKRVRES